MSKFIYLLNALENAAQDNDPYGAGYPAKRQAVLDYVASLEAPRAEERRSGWIPVKNWLPEEFEEHDGLKRPVQVLAAMITGTVVIIYARELNVLYCDALKNDEDCAYVAWMPLPDGPSKP